MRTILTLILFLLSFNLFAMDAVKDEYVIKLSNQKSAISPLNFFFEKNRSKKRIIKNVANMFHVELSKEALEDFKNRYGSAIEFIEPNYIYKASAIPSDQWGLSADRGIKAAKAWGITTGVKDVVVAVIDTGIDYNHYALKDNMWTNTKETKNGKDDDGNGYIDDIHGFDFVNNDGDPFDDNMHGTHCAGIIAANSADIMGIAPNVRVMAVKFLSGEGSGTLADAVSSIKYAVDNGANVLSNSWGGGGYSEALEEAIKYAESRNVLFVAAAGNEYNNNDKYPTYPAGYLVDNVISVAASTEWGTKPGFSNYGKESVHLFAPGYNIISSVPNGGRKSLSGTSMATPFVSGVAALYLSLHGKVDYREVKEAMLNTVDVTDYFSDKVITGGQLNAYKTLNY